MQNNNTTDSSYVDRLLRCRKTQRYFSTAGWTADLSQAKTFPNQLDAIRECLHHGLADVDLVLRTSGGGADLFTTALC